MTKKSELEAAYLEGLGATVIALIANPGISFEMAPWPGAEHWRPAEIVAVYCFERASHAEMVMLSLTTMPTDAEEAMRLLSQAVDAVGAQWQSVEQIVEGAASVTAEIEMHVTAWNKSGGLSDFNAAYKMHRQRCLATSQIATSYSDFLHAFKLKIARVVGENIAAGRPKYDGVGRMQPDPLPAVAVDHLRHPPNGRRERYDDKPKTGRPHIPGWSHPNH